MNREPFICPYHNVITDNGWCWECAQETYGYDDCQKVFEKFMEGKKWLTTLLRNS